MPDALKTLLVRLGLDTKPFSVQIQKIKSDMKAANDEAKKDASSQTAAETKHEAAVQKTIDKLKIKEAGAKAILAIEKAQSEKEKSTQEAINTKIKTKILETAEIKKQSLESQKQLLFDKQSLVIAKEHLKTKEQEANLFNVGTIKSKVKFTPFQPPTVGIPPQEQMVQLTAEKLRLLVLDKQVQALELQGKYRKIDAEFVRSLIGAERALAEASELGVKHELARLKVLEQEAVAAARVANPEAMARLKSGVGFAAFTPAAQGATLEQQEATVVKERQRLATMEAELRVLSSQESIRAVDVIAVEKEISVEKAKLSVEETQLRIRQEAARAAASTPIPANVAALRAQVEAAAMPRVAPIATGAPTSQLRQMTVPEIMTELRLINQASSAMGPTGTGTKPMGVGGMPVTQVEFVAQQRELVNEARSKLTIEEQSLKVASSQTDVRKIDVMEVQKRISEERAELAVMESHLRIQEQQVQKSRLQESLQSRTVNQSSVSQIAQRVGMGPGVEAPVVGGLTGVGGMLGPSASSVLTQTAEERKKLGLYEAELKVLAQQDEFRKIDVAEVQKSITAERQKLTLLEMQVKEQREQSLMGRITSKIGESTGAVGGMMQRMMGGGLLGGVAGGMFTGFVGAEIFSGLIENIHKLGEAVVEETGVSHQMRLEFERLAQMHGIAPTQMIEDLRKSTRGLVADTELFKMANNVLRSGMKVTNDQIMALISNTLNLGRSMGKSTDQTTHALELAFLNPQRGMMTLARQTGIQVQVLRQAIAGLPATLDPAAKATIMFNHILAEEEKMLNKVGVPVTTMPELFMQLRTAQRNFIDDMAQGALGTNSLEASIQKLSQWLIAHEGDLERWAKAIGEKLSDAIQWTMDHATELKRTFEVLLGLKLLSFIANLTGGFSSWGVAIGFVVSQLKKLEILEAAQSLFGMGKTAAKVAAVGVGEDALAVAGGGAAATVATAAAGGATATVGIVALAASAAVIAGYLLANYGSEIWYWIKNAAKQAVGIVPDFTPPPRQLGEAPAYAKGRFTEAEDVTGKTVKVDKTPGKDVTDVMSFFGSKVKSTDDEDNANMMLLRKLADQRKQIEMTMAQLHLDQLKQRIAAEEDALKNQYDEGIISLKQYVTSEKSVKDEEFNAEMTRLRTDKQAQLTSIQVRTKATIDGVEYEIENEQIAANLRTMVIEKSKVKETELITKHNKEIYTLNRQQINDEQAAYRTLQNDLAKLAKEGVDDRRKTLEGEFKEGFVGADDYIAQRKTLIQEELDATYQGLELKKVAAKNNLEEQQKLFGEEVEARRKADNEMRDLDLHRDDISTQYLQTHYDKTKKFLDMEATISKGRIGPTQSQDQFAISTTLLDVTTQYISKLEQQRFLVESGSTDWMNITEHIAQATEEQQKLNLELIQARDISKPLSGIFGSLGGLFSQFKGTGAKAVGETFSTMSSSLEQISQFSTFIQQQKVPKAPLDIAALRKAATEMFSQRLENAAGKTDLFARALQDDIAALKVHADVLRAKPLVEGTTPLQSAENKQTPFLPEFVPPIGASPKVAFSATTNPLLNLNAPLPPGNPPGMPSNLGVMDNFGTGKSTWGPMSEAGKSGIVASTLDQGFTSASSVVHTFSDALNDSIAKLKEWTSTLHPASEPLQGLPAYQDGTDFVPETGPAILHKGEKVTPADEAARQAKKQTVLNRLMKNLASGVGVVSNEEGKNFFTHPYETLKGMINQQGPLAIKAKEAFSKGDYGRALSYTMNYMVPLIGPQTAQAGEQLSHGDYAGGIGRTLGVALPMVAGKVSSELPKVGVHVAAEAPRLWAEEIGEAKVPGTSKASPHETRVVSMWKDPEAGPEETSRTELTTRNKLNRAASVAFPDNVGEKLVGVKKGGVVDKTLMRDLRKVHKETQEYYQSKGIKEITLYRGSEEVQKQRQPLESWSSSKDVARDYSSIDGQLHKATVPVRAILMSHESVHNWPIPEHAFEKEFTVIGGGLKKVPLQDITHETGPQVAKLHEALQTSGWKKEGNPDYLGDQTTYKRSGSKGRLYVDNHTGRWFQTEGKGDSIEGKNVNDLLKAGFIKAVKKPPSYQTGVDYVPETGPAILHKGEKVTSAKENQPFMGPGNTPLTGTGTIVNIMQMLGLGGNVPKGIMSGVGGAKNYLALIPQPLQSTANFINSLNPNFLQELLAGMHTPSGSAQRKSLISAVNQYAPDLSTSGFNTSAFLNWLKTGTTLPSYQMGTLSVPTTGPAMLHQGEGVFPAGVMQQFVTVLKSATDALQKFTTKLAGMAAPSIAKPLVSSTGVSANLSLLGPGARPEGAIAPLTIPGGGISEEQGVGRSMPAMKSPFDQLATPIENLGKSFTNLFKSSSVAADGTTSFGSKLKDFSSQIEGWAAGISGVIKGVTSGKTGGQGAISGGMAGMQLGSNFGPIGSIAGLVGGGIMGGVFGSKEKQLQQSIHKITDQMQSIVDSMNEGAITLSQAISDLRTERQQAIQTLSQNPKGGKGGGKGGKKGFQPSQAQAVIDQIDAQIAQLVNTQQQLLSQLDQQVAILANPLPFQQYVSSLDTIIQKYQEFAQAAGGNAQAVANAQTYLNESLQAYVTTLSQQLNQAQQTAIQDSLTLLNLEYQRQQIINQEAQQEYDILTQGVLTRQRTTAMTKGQEIGQLQYQANMQLQQIDEQIALQQYKVQTEQQIFDLATTRIGLETQLLTLQEQQADTQNGQTAALLQVVQELQAGMASGSLMSSLSSLGSTPTATGLLTTLMGGLGLGGNVPTGVLTGTGGATNYLNQIPQQFQSITNYINNLDPNFLQNLWAAMQTAPGSAQRQSALAEAQPYSADTNTSGFDFNSFAQWISGGSSITGTTAGVTNSPAPTGPGQLPPGTIFNQPTTPGTAPSSIPGSTSSGQTPYNAVSGSMATLNSNTQSVATSMGTLAQNIQLLITGIKQGYGGAQTSGGGAPPIYNPNPISLGSTVQLHHYGTGGPVAATGPAIVDQGEWVLPAPVVSLMNTIGGVQNFINSLSGRTSGPGPGNITATPIMGETESGTGLLAVHTQLLDMTTQRTNMEMNVVSARQAQLQLESQYLQALNDTMTQIAQTTASNPGGAGSSFESLLSQTYATRGRYGSGGVRREFL
jgi:hypothetical protein